MMITSETKFVGIFSGVTVLVSLGVLCGMLYVIQKKDAAYETALQARATRVAVEKEAESLDRLMSETEDDRAELERYVLTEDSVAPFLSSIGSLARARGVTSEIRSLAVAPIVGTDVFEQLTLEVTVTGAFESVTQILSIFELLPYQAQVRKVTIERVGDSKGEILWRGLYHLSVTKYK